MKQTLFFFILSVIIVSISADDETRIIQQDKNDPQFSATILNREKELNQTIFKLNEGMSVHSRLLIIKTKIMPRQTIVYKGKMKGQDCIKEKNQEDIGNNCVKIEVFDFVDKNKSRGPKNKYFIVAFEAATSTDINPRTSPPRKVTLIKSRILVNDLYAVDKKLVEVSDEDPLTSPDHDDKIFVASQEDNLPENYNEPKPAELGFGRYSISQIENTKTFPLRNHFKREAYINQLRTFHELLQKVYEFNDGNTNGQIKRNSNFIKGSLNY